MFSYPAFNVASYPANQVAGGGAFNPRTIFGSNLQLWLDASDVDTITSAAGAVSQWADKSNNAYHATQGTGAQQPTSGVNTLGGRNVINFNGSQNMSVNSTLGSIMGGANTCWVVARRTTEAGSSNRIFTMSTSGTSNYSIDFSSTAGSVFCRHNNNSTGVTNSGNTNTNFQSIMFRRSSTTQAVSVNSNSGVENTSAANIATVNQVTIGALVTSNRLIGNIAMIVMANVAATPEQTALMRTYITNLWGISA